MQTTHSRLIKPSAALLAIALCAIGLCAYGAADASAAGRYVSFGDSGTTGSGLGETTGPHPLCWQTANSYPEFIKSALSFSDFASAACSAAWVNDFTTPQNLGSETDPLDVAPPQFDTLNGTETLITISIGDNDTGYGDIVNDCLSNTNPSATPCKDEYVTAGVNYFVERAKDLLSYPLGAAIDEAHLRSPNAEIFVIGYPRMVPEDVSNCPGRIDISPGDAPVVNDWQRAVNDTSKATAFAHRAYYVDVFSQSDGHDACQPVAADRWVNPKPSATPTGWSHHPTLAGQLGVATLFINAFNSPRPPFPDPPDPDPTEPTIPNPRIDGTTPVGQTLSVKVNSRKIRAVTSQLAPITVAAPSKNGGKLSVTLARSGAVEFFIDRATPGRVKDGKCRALSARAGKGRKACTRYVSLKSRTTLSLPAGLSTVYFTGRAGGKRLDAGNYRLRATVGSLSAKSSVFSLSH